MRSIEDQTFRLLLLATTLAFAWIIEPFDGAILWAVVAAVIFAPLNRRLLQGMPGRPNVAAALTLLIIIAMVILPLAMVATSLAKEAAGLYDRIQSGEYNLSTYMQQIFDVLPPWVTGLLDRFNLTNLKEIREALASGRLQ